jgi:hypothetical protein
VKADAVIGPSTPASSLFQKKAENTTPTIQAVIRRQRRARRQHPLCQSAKRRTGDDHEILAARHVLYTRARELTPAPWPRNAQDWSPIGAVTLNPERDSVAKTQTAAFDKQPLAA